MKNSFLLITYFLIALSFTESNAAPIKINIKNFGAKGDGITNDHQAFIAASNFINQNKQNIELTIPYGTYIVGLQSPDNTWLLKGTHVFDLSNCQNVTIKGVSNKNGQKPVIKYTNNLYFGAFQTINNQLAPQCTPATDQYNKKICCYIGATFNLNRCSNCTIQNLELDGNQNGMIIGGFYGDKGRQLDHRGFQLINCNQTNLSNLNIHHFGLDGITVTSSNNTTIDKVLSNYNGRQGISWVDGNNLTCTNSQFNYTGRSRIYSAPGAGIDIEPENKKDINNGTFTNCQFIGNTGCGILNDRNSNLANNMTFNNCVVAGIYNWSLWVMGTDFNFNNCKIYGNIVHAVKKEDAHSIGDFTTFDNCYFSNVYNNNKTYAASKYLFDWNNVKVNIKNSVVEASGVALFWLNDLDKRPGLQSQITNTTFTTDYNQGVLTSINSGAVNVQNCTFNYVNKMQTSTEPSMLRGNTMNTFEQGQIKTKLKANNIGQSTNDNPNLFICK